MLFEGVCFILHFPNSKILCCCSHDIFSLSFHIRYPHYFCRRKLMFKFIYLFKSIVWLFKIQINNINLVIHTVCVIATNSHYKFIIFSSSECYRIILKVTIVCVYLFRSSIINKNIKIIFKILSLSLAQKILLASLINLILHTCYHRIMHLNL